MQTDYDYLFKTLVIGPSRAGKTSILARFVDDVFSEDVPYTIGVDLKIKSLKIEGSVCKLGQKRFRTMTQAYQSGTKVILLIIYITNRDSFEELKRNYTVHKLMNFSIGKIVYAVVGNKSDLNENRQISQEEGQQFATDIDCYYAEVSSKDNKGIYELFEVIISEAKKVFNEEAGGTGGRDKRPSILLGDIAPPKRYNCI